MGRYRSRSRSYSPVRRKRYDEPRQRHISHRSIRDRRSPGPTGLLVRNISLNSRVEDLRVPFERFGPVKDVYLPKNYYTGEPRGFGFVKFRFAEDAAEAKHQLDHTVIGGREIRVVFAEENRKTPQEMRRMSRVSGRESYGRRSRSRSPRRRYRSYSHSPSPSRRGFRFSKVKQRLKELWLNKDKRERDHKVKDYLLTFIFKHLQKSLNPSITYNCMCFVVLIFGLDERGRDDRYSSRQSRSVSRSISPRDERNYRSNQRSLRRSRSISEPFSPREDRNTKSSRRARDGIEDGRTPVDEDYVLSRSQSPRENSSSLSRSRSRSRSYSSR